LITSDYLDDAPLLPWRYRLSQVRHPVNTIATVGLAMGAAFGMAGTFVSQTYLQALPWATALMLIRTQKRIPLPVRLLGLARPSGRFVQ
jgi:hypothetical protein